MANKSFVFSFGDVEVREREFSLVKAGEVLAVEPKAFRVLLMLLRNPQKLISKEELLNAVWGDAAVTENSLTRSIALLRRLLGDETRNPRYIETVATVGYRWVCKVEAVEESSEAEEAPAEPVVPVSESNKAEGRKGLWGALASGGVLALCLAGVVWYLRRPLPPPRITGYTQITHDGYEKSLAGTDGDRLYLDWGNPEVIGQMAVSGGVTVPIPVEVPGAFLVDVSTDGSSLLVASNVKPEAGYPLFIARTLGGSARRLGDAYYSVFSDGRTAAFSPDGKSVAYATKDGNIYLVQSDGSGAQKLSSPGGVAEDLAWSPDGALIRFSMNNHLWEMTSSGSNIHQLLPGWHSSSIQCCGRWTPDGKLFIFRLQTGVWYARGAELWVLDERRSLFRKPSSEPVQLTTGPTRWGWPVPGKDGKTIFSQGVTNRGELSRFNAQTKKFEPFLGGISAEGISFSKDGKFVAYVSYPENTLWRANADGSNPVQLTDSPLEAFLPRWSPDGTQIVFTDIANMQGKLTCYLVPAEGGTPQKLIPNDEDGEGDPSWSADGHKIVFGAGNVSNQALRVVIRVLDLDSHQVTTLPGSENLFSPRWSPDGRFIAALSNIGRKLSIFDVESQRWSMPLYTGSVRFPEWSSDSQWIFFQPVSEHVGPGIYRIRIKGGEAELVADLKGWHWTGWWDSWMGLDPTNAPLLLRDAGSDDIYALTLEEK